MKKIFMFSVAILFSVAIFAQNFNVTPVNSPKTNNVRGDVYAQDSTIYYGSFSDPDWNPSSKSISTAFDDHARITTQESYTYSSSTWNKTQKLNITYFNDDNVDTYTIFPWNSNILNWNSDTLVYFNMTPYKLTQFGNEQVYENKIIQLNWDYTTNQITGGSKILITNYHDSLYSEILTLKYDAPTSSYKNFSNRTFSYDANDHFQSALGKKWIDSSSVWENDEQEFYAFSGNNLVQKIEQDWDGTVWDNKTKETYAFDANNNKTNGTFYSWDGSDWKGNYKYDYTYDANNNMLSKIKASWNSTDNDWINTFRYIYQYDANNNQIQYIYQNWDNGNTIWVNNYKYLYSFDANNNLTEKLGQDWDATGSTWGNDEKYTYTFNANNDKTLEQYFSFDPLTSTFNVKNQTIYTYDANNNNTQKLYQVWNNTSSEWENGNKNDYFYSAHSAVNISDVSNSIFSFFPNPTNGIININNSERNLKSVTIYDMNGKSIYTNDNLTSRKTTVNLAQYGTGIYIINVTNVSGKTSTQKVIVQ